MDTLLMVEKDIIGGKCDAIHRYVKTSNKYMKDYNKNKESSYVSIGTQMICKGG